MHLIEICWGRPLGLPRTQHVPTDLQLLQSLPAMISASLHSSLRSALERVQPQACLRSSVNSLQLQARM